MSFVWSSRVEQGFWRLSWLVLLLGALKLIGYFAVIAADAGVIMLLLLLWLPLAMVLFLRARWRRAVVLSACLTDQSRWHHRLRGGVVMAAIQAVAAVPLALLLLAVISQPQAPGFWWLLLLAAPLWLFVWSRSARVLQADFNARFLPHAVAVTAVRVSGFVLVLLWLVLSLWTPVADVSSLTLFQAARFGSAEAVGESGILLAGASIWHGFSYAHLWLVQALVDSVPSSLLSLLAWMLLLIQGACFIWPVLLLMQGITMFADHRLVNGRPDMAVSSGAPVRLSAGVAVLVLVSWSLLAPRPWGWLVGDVQVVQIGGTRYVVPTQQLDKVLRDNASRLDLDLAGRFISIQRRVEVEFDRLFADARARVPDYADWHYSFTGAMTRNAFELMEYFQADNERAVRLVSERLFPPALWQQKLHVFEQVMAEEYRRQLVLLRDDMLSDLQHRLSGREAHPHFQYDAASVVNLDRLSADGAGAVLRGDVALGQSGVAVALGAGAAAFSLTQSVRAAAQSRVAAQGSARAASRLASRGTAAGGAGFCAASGPLALGCAVIVFTGVTLASEYALLKADEFLSRKQLEADLLRSLAALQQATSEDYSTQILAALSEASTSMHGDVVATLRPIDRLR